MQIILLWYLDYWKTRWLIQGYNAEQDSLMISAVGFFDIFVNRTLSFFQGRENYLGEHVLTKDRKHCVYFLTLAIMRIDYIHCGCCLMGIFEDFKGKSWVNKKSLAPSYHIMIWHWASQYSYGAQIPIGPENLDRSLT